MKEMKEDDELSSTNSGEAKQRNAIDNDKESVVRVYRVRVYLSRKQARRRTKLLQLAPIAKDGKEYRYSIIGGNDDDLFHLTHRRGITSLKLERSLRRGTKMFKLLVEGRPLEVEVGEEEEQQVSWQTT